MMRYLVCTLCLIGCGAADESATETSPAPREEAAGAVTGETGAADPEDERARVIREAEAFVRAQGYTDAPPTVAGDAIVREGIEGTLEDRRGMLEPRAARAVGSGGEWTVIFRYRDPRYEGRGRALRMRAGQTPQFVHQDVILSAWGAD